MGGKLQLSCCHIQMKPSLMPLIHPSSAADQPLLKQHVTKLYLGFSYFHTVKS